SLRRIVFKNVNAFAETLQKASHDVALRRLKTPGGHHAYGGKRIFEVAEIEQDRQAGGFGAIDKRAGEHGGVDETALQCREAISAAAAAHQSHTFLVHAPVSERGGNDDLVEPHDGKNADLLATQILRRANTGASDEAIGVSVEVGADDDGIGSGEVGGDMRLGSDYVELNLAAGASRGRPRLCAREYRVGVAGCRL